MTVYIDWEREILVSTFEDFMEEIFENPSLEQLFEEYLDDEYHSFIEVFNVTDDEKEPIYKDFFDYWKINYTEERFFSAI